jgi:hypothetical protein
MINIVITESQLRVIISESVKIGSPEELIGLLELLPVNETAKYIGEEIYQDAMNYYENDVELPSEKKYTYYPEEKCLTPYEVTVSFQLSNNGTNIGYADQHYIQLKVLSKNSIEYKNLRNIAPTNTLVRGLPKIIKHECSHFYLSQRGIENCLYNTHPDGMKKYYQDRQELVLHSREIFDTFEEDYPNWKSLDIDVITKRIKNKVDNLRTHTNIYAPYNAGTQKKYLNFIINNYIKPHIK